MENTKRTVTCGELRKSDVGKKVVLNGWVSRTRDLGGLLFIRLRDRYGITQVMVGDKASDDVKKIAATAIANNMILITHNIEDYAALAENSMLQMEDWWE